MGLPQFSSIIINNKLHIERASIEISYLTFKHTKIFLVKGIGGGKRGTGIFKLTDFTFFEAIFVDFNIVWETDVTFTPHLHLFLSVDLLTRLLFGYRLKILEKV